MMLENEIISKLPSVFSAVDAPVFLFGSDWVVVDANAEAKYFSAQGEPSPIGRSFQDIFLSLPVPSGDCAVQTEVAGKRVLIRFMQTRLGYLALILPEQSRAELEKELAEARETLFDLNAVFNFSYDGIFVTDGNAVGLRINESYHRVTGIENAQDMVGMSMHEVVDKGFVSESVSLQVLKHKKAITTRPKLKSGKEILMTGTPVFDDKGKIIRIITNVRDISELLKLNKELEEVRQQSQRYYTELLHLRSQNMPAGNCVASSPAMRKVAETALKVAETDLAVLITGDSGVGKEVIARLIHDSGARKKNPFIKINCGAIPENLLESELFGYERGAFTSASTRGKVGLFELAESGTLFLDEIGELPLALQVKLLGVLQDLKFMRIGGTEEKKLNARILAATNQDLEKMIAEKKFRCDLFYRICVASIHVPPLRERKEDIFALACYYLDRYNSQYKTDKSLSSQAMDALKNYPWPGNVRQLQHVIEQTVALTEGAYITLDALPADVRNHGGAARAPVSAQQKSLPDILRDVEAEILTHYLQQGWSSYKIARELGISQPTAVRKIQRLISNKEAIHSRIE